MSDNKETNQESTGKTKAEVEAKEPEIHSLFNIERLPSKSEAAEQAEDAKEVSDQPFLPSPGRPQTNSTLTTTSTILTRKPIT